MLPWSNHHYCISFQLQTHIFIFNNETSTEDINCRRIHLNYSQQEFFSIRYLIAYERSFLLPEIRILQQVYLSGQFATRCCLNQLVTLVLISRIRWESNFGLLSCLVFSLPISNHYEIKWFYYCVILYISYDRNNFPMVDELKLTLIAFKRA